MTFEDAHREYQNTIYEIILASLNSQDAAEDVAQQTFIEAYSAWKNRDTGVPVGEWLTILAAKNCDEHKRGQNTLRAA